MSRVRFEIFKNVGMPPIIITPPMIFEGAKVIKHGHEFYAVFAEKTVKEIDNDDNGIKVYSFAHVPGWAPQDLE